MRIGILTLPFNNNYGGYLQAYALMTVLKRMGHEVELINRRRNKPSLKQRIKYFLLGIRGLMVKSKKHNFFIDGEKEYMHRGKAMLGFVEKNILPMTAPIYNAKDLQMKYGAKYDVYIVGSDQVWRPIYVPDVRDYFFRFVTGNVAKKIAYAASFGTSHPEYNHDICNEICRLITRIDHIGLREVEMRDVIQNYGWQPKRPMEVVLDPTMLLTREHYLDIIKDWKPTVKSQEKLLDYILDHNMQTERLLVKAEEFLCVKRSDIIDTKHWKEKKYVMPSIEEWLYSIANAEFMITDSFHGTVFSILFNTPFAVHINNNRGADRFHTLLGHFNLQNRIVKNEKELVDILQISTDWDSVNKMLEKKRQASMSFLKKSINY